MMRKKLGLFGELIKDETLINDLLAWMNQSKADYTNIFCSLSKKNVLKDKLFQDSKFLNWYQQWQTRLMQNKKSKQSSLNLMCSVNPLVIPRNYKVEEALDAANINGDLVPMYNLLEVLKKPYDNRQEIKSYQFPPVPNEKIYQTFCGT
jgi:uncharacterized protein YdiU (UPF0061 family)